MLLFMRLPADPLNRYHFAVEYEECEPISEWEEYASHLRLELS